MPVIYVVTFYWCIGAIVASRRFKLMNELLEIPHHLACLFQNVFFNYTLWYVQLQYVVNSLCMTGSPLLQLLKHLTRCQWSPLLISPPPTPSSTAPTSSKRPLVQYPQTASKASSATLPYRRRLTREECNFTCSIQGGPKVSHYQIIKKFCLPVRLDLFLKLKHQSSTIILSVGIKYSVLDLLFDAVNYT